VEGGVRGGHEQIFRGTGGDSGSSFSEAQRGMLRMTQIPPNPNSRRSWNSLLLTHQLLLSHAQPFSRTVESAVQAEWDSTSQSDAPST